MKLTAKLQIRLWRNLALLACFFVFLFAVRAKISAYQGRSAAPSETTANKMLGSTETPASDIVMFKVLPQGMPLLLLLSAFACTFLLKQYWLSLPHHTHSSSFFESAYAYPRFLRPPPVR